MNTTRRVPAKATAQFSRDVRALAETPAERHAARLYTRWAGACRADVERPTDARAAAEEDAYQQARTHVDACGLQGTVFDPAD